MAIQVSLPDLNVKKIVEGVFDFFITLVAVSIAGSIFLPEGDANLKQSLPALATVAAIGLLTWKVAASHKLIDK